ncbi:mitochondrial citrate transmembrane transport protein [Malassezia pachydermatis]|uniref:Mitochondrial tricarboxylate transporter n=1 Tax=Malassezia pachydermatis TaxID=77020 RepID=A0A0M8MQ62_9BASI|nr:mitochondrial tricarboxylate transporter [Malassezia pachydermatis]KOS16118.1 mitochondrial tricarboxylate transporter [Malassezia pachydermatis]
MAAKDNNSAARSVNPVFSLVSGTFAGAVEGFATYPIEYTKTVAQFSTKAGEKPPNPITIARETVSKHGIRGLYSGCGALVAGNALKAGVRFLSYDHFKSMLKDENGKLTAPRSLLAGLGAGMMEAIFAVTPSETIKTKLIDDAKRVQPKYPRGLIPGSMAIIRDEGLTGIYRGLVPVMLRQGANSSVRFGTYSTLRNFVQGSSRPGQPLPSGITFGIGAVAGIVTVYATMPLDVVKTRMQTLEARTQYKNTLDCMVKILRHEGILAFWRGATPRLARLMLSGGIVFTVYEKCMDALNSMTAK